jgi:transient receptor potential cation channel subfamily V protein 5
MCFCLKMFQFILEKQRQVWFTYGEISCGTYPMATIDTIAEDGNTDTTSAIYLVVNGVIVSL